MDPSSCRAADSKVTIRASAPAKKRPSNAPPAPAAIRDLPLLLDLKPTAASPDGTQAPSSDMSAPL